VAIEVINSMQLFVITKLTKKSSYKLGLSVKPYA